jgi:DNA-binding winged helix-turn-helix (wHTH) protein
MANDKIRFGPFELDPRAGELRRGSRRVRLQEKSLKVLEALLGARGEVVTREELRTRLWPANLFVDFDNGLNNAVNKLRTVLADSATAPKYIETVGRRGYRFIGTLAPTEVDAARSRREHEGGRSRGDDSGEIRGPGAADTDRSRPTWCRVGGTHRDRSGGGLGLASRRRAGGIGIAARRRAPRRS